MSFGHERLSRLLAQPDIAYDDRLSACKALADVASHADNALRIATSAELTQSMSNILNVSRSPDIDRRHQAQVCLAITRCVAAGGKDVSLAFSKSPGLVEGLCKLKRDPEAFVQVSAICALRLLGRCDEACGVNRRLLRAKWQNVLDADQTTGPSQRSPASQHPARPAHASQEQPEDIHARREERRSASSRSEIETFKIADGKVYSSNLYGSTRSERSSSSLQASSRETAEHMPRLLDSSALRVPRPLASTSTLTHATVALAP
eukprot:Tamp_22979.p1 GENE.Tamp_22979~~Tamp_22979.p1  ORF type:complete len:308 (+),score=45.37 Tamp_22979:138-926(+)